MAAMPATSKQSPAAASDPASAAGGADMGADTGADDGSDDSDMGDQSGQVLLTVLKNSDGTYQLVEGDEDDGDEGGEADQGGEASPSEGTEYDSPGALLKAILDILKKDEGSAGSAQSSFEQGFSENSPTPAAPATPAQKY